MITERVSFSRSTVIDDGEGGTIGGAPQVVYSCFADIEPLKATRTLEAAQTSLRQGYRLLIWITTQFEPKSGDTILYRDERLTIQGYRYADEAKRKYEITALEQVGEEARDAS